MQPDLFVSTPRLDATPARAPVEELSAILASLRAADRLPWADAAATMVEAQRALELAWLAGPAGEKLAAAILLETERLLSTTI